MDDIPALDHTVFPAQLESLEKIMDWVRVHAQAAGLRDAVLKKFELAAEEVIVNVIHYAYKNRPGEIDLTWRYINGVRVELIIKDQGGPFNPLLKEFKPKKDCALEEIPVGGLGIFLMRRLVDDVNYEREHPYNVLTLIKNLNECS